MERPATVLAGDELALGECVEASDDRRYLHALAEQRCNAAHIESLAEHTGRAKHTPGVGLQIRESPLDSSEHGRRCCVRLASCRSADEFLEKERVPLGTLDDPCDDVGARILAEHLSDEALARSGGQASQVQLRQGRTVEEGVVSRLHVWSGQPQDEKRCVSAFDEPLHELE